MNDEDNDRQHPNVRLVGGGRDSDVIVALVAEFVADAAATCDRDGETPRIHARLVLEDDDEESVERFRSVLSLAGANVVVKAIVEGETFDESAIHGADGLFVGGGLTPAYHDAFARISRLVRTLVTTGTPYLGFSAGAAIAAEHALIGGHSIGGVPICDEAAGEELADVTVVSGLGLVPFSVDVHAAQWGTVSRMIAAVGAGLLPSGVAIDEHTAVHWRGGRTAPEAAVSGRGSAWHIARSTGSANSVIVNRLTGEH